MLVERYQYLSVFFFWISELSFIFLFPFLAFHIPVCLLNFSVFCCLVSRLSFFLFSAFSLFCFLFFLPSCEHKFSSFSSLIYIFPNVGCDRTNELLSPPFVLISSNSVWLNDFPLSSLKTKQKITDGSFFAFIFPRYIYIFQTFPGLTVYSATKYFVESLTQGLRLEIVGSEVKVTSIQPGNIAIYIN